MKKFEPFMIPVISKVWGSVVTCLQDLLSLPGNPSAMMGYHDVQPFQVVIPFQ